MKKKVSVAFAVLKSFVDLIWSASVGPRQLNIYLKDLICLRFYLVFLSNEFCPFFLYKG